MTNFNPWDTLKSNQENKDKSDKSQNIFNNGNFKFFNPKNSAQNINLNYLPIAILIIYLLSGFFVIKPDEEAIITRFEKFARVKQEGLHYKLPYPFEKKYTSSVSFTRTLRIGSENEKKGQNLILTKDENIVDTNFEIQWKIKNLKDYIFNIKNPDKNLNQISESVVRENIGQFNLSEILTNKRQEIELLTKENIQKILDDYQSGIEITSVQMLRVDPPKEVIDSFRDVQTARVDKESEINKAMLYYNTKIPEARGTSKEIIAQAETIAFEKINKAKGETLLFDKIYLQYKNSPATTRMRIYIEQMENLFKKSEITVVDSNLKNIFMHISGNKNEIKSENLKESQEVLLKKNENQDNQNFNTEE